MVKDAAMIDRLIDNAFTRMMRATTEGQQRWWCDRLTHWVKQRSPERVAVMEREKGLA
jgi:hypothetical protein